MSNVLEPQPRPRRTSARPPPPRIVTNPPAQHRRVHRRQHPTETGSRSQEQHPFLIHRRPSFRVTSTCCPASVRISPDASDPHERLHLALLTAPIIARQPRSSAATFGLSTHKHNRSAFPLARISTSGAFSSRTRLRQRADLSGVQSRSSTRRSESLAFLGRHDISRNPARSSTQSRTGSPATRTCLGWDTARPVAGPTSQARSIRTVPPSAPTLYRMCSLTSPSANQPARPRCRQHLAGNGRPSSAAAEQSPAGRPSPILIRHSPRIARRHQSSACSTGNDPAPHPRCQP